ncbi:MAG: hypothetical protein KGI38_03815 [Thaumarchaeota archaeon]|nr:hypothetical protein [Nitrososphaerota archaeon]
MPESSGAAACRGERSTKARHVARVSLGSKRVAISAFISASLIAEYVMLGGFFRAPVLDLLGFDLGYFAFPFFVLAVFLVIYAYSWPLIRLAWARRRVKRASWLAGGGFAVFYLFATNMVSTPDAGLPAPPHGYFVASQVYSQMAIWPDIEFWSPRIDLFGYFSVGSVLLLVSLGLLASFAFALLTQSISLRTEGRRSKGTTASFAGALVVSLFTNSCCCCAPLVLPLISVLAGVTATTSLQYSILVPGPFSDLLAVADLAILLASIMLSTRRISSCSTDENASLKTETLRPAQALSPAT